MDEHEACCNFVDWLDRRILFMARGDDLSELDVDPSGRLWLGRLAPEEGAANRGMGDRGERLDPCAIGIVVQPTDACQTLTVNIRACGWIRKERELWKKSAPISISVNITVNGLGESSHGADAIASALSAAGVDGLRAELRTEVTATATGRLELTILLVNTSPEEHPILRDTNLYETSLDLEGASTEPFLLESLPDSFRYDRGIPAYGMNCGVIVEHGQVRNDGHDQCRPWKARILERRWTVPRPYV